MRYKVIGWVNYDNERLEECACTEAVCSAIVDEIVKNGLTFNGNTHQYREGCAPVMNNGKKCCFSQRGWGAVMAEAHGMCGYMDYSYYAFPFTGDKVDVYPTNLITSKKQLESLLFDAPNERIVVDVEDVLDWQYGVDVLGRQIKNPHKIKDDDNVYLKILFRPEYRYVEVGDTIVVGKKSYVVNDVLKQREYTDELFEKLHEKQYCTDFISYFQSDEYKQACKDFDNLPFLLFVNVGTKL